MDDVIRRQDAIDAICTWDKFGVDERGRVVRWHEGLEPYVHLRDVVVAITNLPSAEPDIIRCKDCKYKNRYRLLPKYEEEDYCEKHGKTTDVNNYCSWAERREDETN